MMTKKNYIRAAEIAAEGSYYQNTTIGSAIATSFVIFFREDNPRFEASRFFTHIAKCKVALEISEDFKEVQPF